MGEIITHVHKYTELATGMHYQDANGQWLESKEEIEGFAGGAIARQGQHLVIFANNLNTVGSIDMQTPDGKRLRSNVLGLGYFDNSTGNSVLIAQIQDSEGELISANQVLYPNAFSGVKADVRYTYRKGGFEQDVILREQPPTPESLGLNPDTTVLEVMTEFIDPPDAAIISNRLQMDEDINWGAVQIGRGKAFDLEATINGRSWLPVQKQFMDLQGRHILLEMVRAQKIRPMISKLPFQSSIQKKSPVMLAKERVLPGLPLAKTTEKPIKFAVSTPSNKGYVLDYVIVNLSANNFTFQSDTTYFINGWDILAGTTTFEGGTVIKYSSNPNAQATLDIYDSWVCATSPYRPAIFTSMDDNTVGETISGSTGNPSTVTNAYFFVMDSATNTSVNNLRFCYAQYALAPLWAGPVDVWDCQFFKCQNAVDHYLSTDVRMHNVLLAKCRSVVAFEGGSGPSLIGENITADVANLIDTNLASAVAIKLTNSIVSCAPTSVWTTALTINCSVINPSGSLFQIAGGAGYYLTNNSVYRDAGTTNISPALTALLKAKTTYPPIVYITPGVYFYTNLNLYAQALRDTNNMPDLGYHYDPLDYIFSPIFITNATITLNAGTAVGLFMTNGYSYGFGLSDNSQLISQGAPNSLNRIVGYNTVQEQRPTGWSMPWYALVAHFSGTQPYSFNCRFTDFSVLVQDSPLIQISAGTNILSFRDCQFHGGALLTYYPSVCLTNCLLERVNMDIEPSDNYTSVFRNNLFYGGTFGFAPVQTNSIIVDNLFDRTAIPDWLGAFGTTYIGGHNAFVTNYDKLDPIYASDLVLSNPPVYQANRLGNYYLPSSSPIINAGSVAANQVGLYQFTTQTNQAKEAGSIVDIGYHYVAVDAAGNPIDTNGNGIPDYLEDSIGSGTMFVLLTSPTDGSYFVEPANVTLTATVTGWGLTTNVNFYHESNNIAGDSSAPYQYSWPIVPHGQYTLTAVASVQGGIILTSPPVYITITNFCGSY